MIIDRFWLDRKEFCDGRCNDCAIPENRQLTVVLNALRDIFGKGVYEVVQHYCPNMTCCADCRIDDFCHDEECELANEANRCRDVMRGRISKNRRKPDLVEWDPETGKVTEIDEDRRVCNEPNED